MSGRVLELRRPDPLLAKEAHECHDAALDDLLDAITMYRGAGQHRMADAVSAHTHALAALRVTGGPKEIP